MPAHDNSSHTPRIAAHNAEGSPGAGTPGKRCGALLRLLLALALAVAWCPGCGAVGPQEAEWPPLAKKWYERANASFRALDADDAQESIAQALRLEPNRAEVRELAARIALSDLDHAAALKHTEGLNTPTSLALRARAHWYSGATQAAAEELELLLADPNVRDPWAEGVVKLARQGRGRQPYSIKGELLAVMEMPRVATTAMVVPVDLNGQPVLALISTGQTEVYIDSAGGREPSWVSLRFGDRVEVKDVPALTRDLSGVSRELKTPIKVLIGTHALRHLNATMDFLGRQFVVRTFVPPAPPVATKVPVRYVRGGGMALRSRIGTDERSSQFALLIDTGSSFPLVLDEPAWQRTATDLSTRTAVPGHSDLKQAVLPRMEVGAFGIPNVSAVSGVPIDELEQSLDIELDGLVGSGLLSAFRITLTDEGKTLWLEDAPTAEERAAAAPPMTGGSAPTVPSGPAAGAGRLEQGGADEAQPTTSPSGG
jgi:hypothetical protein